MTRKPKLTFTPQQKLEYAKSMVKQGYTDKQIEDMSAVRKSAVSRWKRQYKAKLAGKTPEKSNILKLN